MDINRENVASGNFLNFSLSFLLIFGITCLALFKNVMGMQDIDGNEVFYLPLAKQFVNPSWIPNDWFLDQKSGYLILFQSLFGQLVDSAGFFAGTLLGRALCYLLISVGIVLVGSTLRLNGILLALAWLTFAYPRTIRRLVESQFTAFDFSAIASALLLLSLLIFLVFKTVKERRIWLPSLLLFFCFVLFIAAQNSGQGIVAKESIVTGLEAKSIAYGLVLFGIAALLHQKYRWMAMLLGIATSFHVLVGGYAFLCVLGTFVWTADAKSKTLKQFFRLALIYGLGSVFAIRPVLHQLFAASPNGEIPYSVIYVFFRHPHHLDPGSWPGNWWFTFSAYLFIALVSFSVVQQQTQNLRTAGVRRAAATLLKLALISAIPFLVGVAIAPFDTQGKLLQYYPFRLCDVLLPLVACLLFFTALSQLLIGQRKQFMLVAICALVLALGISDRATQTAADWQTLQQFPVAEAELGELYTWVRTSTPATSRLVTFPNQMNDFTWITERPTIAKLKFTPAETQKILEWNQRLTDLNGGAPVWPQEFERGFDVWQDVGQLLNENYAQLNEAQVADLMRRYDAPYFVTERDHALNLAVAFQNDKYVVYTMATPPAR